MQPDLSLAIFTIVILIFSVIIHEVAHGYAAYMLGDQTAKRAGRLTLNPLAHIDLFGSIIIPAILVLSNVGLLFGWAKPVPYNPNNLTSRRFGLTQDLCEAIVGFAGVGTNILLAILFALITRAATIEGAVMFANLAATVTFVNLSLGLFNLIPIPPLDGYTVLRGILPLKLSMSFRALEARIYGNSIITRLIVIFIFVYFLATPFYDLIEWLFKILVGA